MMSEPGHEHADRWDLSAPASQVLLTGAATPNAWAIKLAFKELVLRRALRLGTERQRRFLVFHREVGVLAVERWPTKGTERSLLGVMEAFPKAALFRTDAGAVAIDVAAREVQRWYRSGGGYVQAEVLPHLQWRGFYRITETMRGKEWELTPAGMQKLAELRALLDTGATDLPVWLRSDREKAAAYLTGAGATLLLLGNPVTWLWEVMAEALAGSTVTAERIPVGGGSPFVIPPPQERTDREGGGAHWSEYQTWDADEHRPTGDDGAERPGDAIDTSHAGGGGGGFESPGEAIDAGFGDGDGGGDSDGDGE